MDLQHTEVPDAYRGRGIAKHLAKVGRGVDRCNHPEDSRTLAADPSLSSWPHAAGCQAARVILFLAPLSLVAVVLGPGPWFPTPKSLGPLTTAYVRRSLAGVPAPGT